MSLPRYGEYKDSGTWLGHVPSKWAVMRLMQVASVNDDVLPESTKSDFELEYVDIGSVSLDRGIERTEQFKFSDAPSRARRMVKDGDILVSTVRTYLKAIAPVVAPPSNLIVSTGFAVIRPALRLKSAYAKYALQATGFVDEVISRSTGVSYPAINASDLVRICVPVPPAADQAAIAAFLDREIAKIDALIAEQEKLIALLAEKRQATITHAVTKGLNPKLPMKDSGVAWLGEVPAHWSVKKLRHLAEVVRGASPRPAGDPQFFAEDNDCGLNRPWVTVAEVTKDQAIYLDQVTEYLTPAGVERSQSFDAGTLIFTNSGATLGVPKVLAIDCCANDGILAFLNLSDEANIFFLYYFLLSTTERLRTEMKQGGGQPNLNTGIVKDISFAMPPYQEQLYLVERLQAELLKLENLRVEAGRTVALLSERRSALIAAAVTGQIDVRDIVLQAAVKHPEAIAA